MLRRLGLLLQALASYARIAWWGLVAPHTTEKRPLVVLQAVLLSPEGRVLLGVRSDLLGWELPGGTLEPGEGPEEALRREIREETGLEIEVERHVGDYVRRGFRPHTARVYRCSPRGGTLHPGAGGEVLELPWFEPGALPVQRDEHQGLRAVLAGMHIDLRMRMR